jgi:hypothetical protein
LRTRIRPCAYLTEEALNATSTRFSTAHALARAGAFAALAVASARRLAQTPDTALGRDLRGVLEFLKRATRVARDGTGSGCSAHSIRRVSACPTLMLQMELRDIPIRDPTLSPAVAEHALLVEADVSLGDKRELRRGLAETEVAASDARRGATLASCA